MSHNVNNHIGMYYTIPGPAEYDAEDHGYPWLTIGSDEPLEDNEIVIHSKLICPITE